jgi:hypothetical protein
VRIQLRSRVRVRTVADDGNTTEEVGTMIVALTVRRLRPGSYEQFRQAWEPEEWPAQWDRAYHVRNVADANEVISFGFFDGTLEELQHSRRQGPAEEERQRRMAELVESTGADGLYEVIEEVVPPAR